MRVESYPSNNNPFPYYWGSCDNGSFVRMKLKIVRKVFNQTETLGKLFIDDKVFCDTLEDVDRKLEKGGVKIPAETAIPRGTYNITIDWSNRFQKYMIHVLNVPQFEGVRIHGGKSLTTHKDTEGCPLVGQAVESGLINSRVTSQKLFDLVEAAIKEKKKVTLEVV